MSQLPLGVMLSMGAILVVVVLGVAAPLIAPHDPIAQSLPSRMLPPAWLEGGDPSYLLGTDGLGRDILSRIIYGARISLSISCIAIVAGGGIGGLVGIIAGYSGGLIDATLMRLVDVFMSIPTILFAIALAVALGPSFGNLAIVISIVLWPNIARLVRGSALEVRHQLYVRYATAIKIPPWRILFQHILPNVTPALLVVLTLEVGAVILTEASLGFLGAGVPPPQPSWGVIVAEGRALISTGWWIAVFPGLAIVATVLAFNTVGDWLRDYFDPRLKKR